MAKGYVDQLLNTLPAEIRRPVSAALQYVQDNWRLGDGSRASNAQWYKFTATTDPVANTEFAILHGQGQTPSKLIPVLDLTSIGSQLVPLAVTRQPDAQRVYLSSGSTSAFLTVYLEF
jgi:hypothetical protein